MRGPKVSQLRTQLEEAVLEVRNLTALLDESMKAEQEEKILEELQMARARVLELERTLREAEGAG